MKLRMLHFGLTVARRGLSSVATLLLIAAASLAKTNGDGLVRVTGIVSDATTGKPIECRLYIKDENTQWYFPDSSDSRDVVVYKRSNYWDKSQVEMHATIAAKPFHVALPTGKYTVSAERGKEYLPIKEELTVDPDHTRWELKLQRWTNMASRGWYSGDMHCHRELRDLPNLMLAEDLNVCFPITNWTTSAEVPPSRGDKSVTTSLPDRLVTVNATHVWYPRNTEYEIFKTGGKNHTLGAFLILNHRRPFDVPCLPLERIAKQAREDGALIDLEKHNWEWAAVVAPILPVDLFELANNHDWRIGFGVKNWGAAAPDWMGIKGPLTIDRESDWIEYGWQFYYALLNCGLKITPTAGSASGAHPVPLGYSRVYVHLPAGFSYDAWLAELKDGHSFVSTGPMLLLTANGRDPGEVVDGKSASELSLRLQGEAISAEPLERIEIVWNGAVQQRISPKNERSENAYSSRIDATLRAKGNGWVAVRCVGRQTEAGGLPFAHTAPWHVQLAGPPLRPRRAEVEYFLQRVEQEIERNRTVLSSEQLADYYRARDFWRAKLDKLSESSSDEKNSGDQ
jgi:hypothetical protein